MTGFAQVKRDCASGELTLSLRSVNHRGLDLHFYQSTEFAAVENGMRALLKENIGRGHIEIRAGLRGSNGTRSGLNTEALKEYVNAVNKASAELGLAYTPDLNTLIGLPGVVVTQANEAAETSAEFEQTVLGGLKECIGIFNECRLREGVKLRADMLGELQAVKLATEEVRNQRGQATAAFQQRLSERLKELLSGSTMSEARIVEEAALLVDRSDIQEEITRLSVHSDELERILTGGGAVGKQVDFLLQEMNRETNTMLSKSSNAGEPGMKITALGLGVKAAIERIREQALNLE